MVNGFRFYRALESVSIASALSTLLPFTHAIYESINLTLSLNSQLPAARKKEWWPATSDSSPHAVTCQHCDTHCFSRPRTRNLPIVGWLLVRRATSSATDSPELTVTYRFSLLVLELRLTVVLVVTSGERLEISPLVKAFVNFLLTLSKSHESFLLAIASYTIFDS